MVLLKSYELEHTGPLYFLFKTKILTRKDQIENEVFLGEKFYLCLFLKFQQHSLFSPVFPLHADFLYFHFKY